MKKSRYVIMLISISLIILTVVAIIFINYLKKDNNHNANEQTINESQNTENDDAGIETIEADGYTIILRGSARPQNGEISVEEAAEIGVKELEKEYNIDVVNEVEMIFLDGISTSTGTWSGHLNLSNNEKYEFLIDGMDGSIEFINKNA